MYQKMEKMGVMQFMKEIQIKEKRATTDECISVTKLILDIYKDLGFEKV